MRARRLILMRHASAAAGGGRDFERRLTPRGQEEARRVGERMREAGFAPDRVVCSSALRCCETWQGVVEGLASPGPRGRAVTIDDSLYDASTSTLLAAIRDEVGASTLLVLAHNPGISLLALELGRRDPADEERLREGFSPASFAVFEFDGEWRDVEAGRTVLVAFERTPH